MTRYIFIILFYLIANAIFAQRVSDVSFTQQGQNIIITYDLTGVKYYQVINIAVFVSTDGGKIYNGPLKKVEGDVGLNIIPGNDKKIIWDVFEEMPDFGGQVSFEVRAVVNDEKPKRKIYAGYKGSYLAPLGITVGITGKTGFYVSTRADFPFLNSIGKNFYLTNGGLVQDYDEHGYYLFTAEHRSQRFSVTGGLSFQLSRNLRLYAGGGYALNNILWEIERFSYNNDESLGKKWVKNTEESWAFPELESGLWLQIKPVFISAGASVCGNKRVDAVLSVGYIF